MPAPVSPETSSFSAEEEDQLLDPSRESSNHESRAHPALSPEAEKELALVKKEVQKQTTLALGLPTMRTAMHAIATWLNPFSDTGSTDSRIIATALATLLTYGFLPLRQLRTSDKTLRAKRKQLREDLSLLEHYPGVDANLVNALRTDLKSLKKGHHRFDYLLVTMILKRLVVPGILIEMVSCWVMEPV